MRAVRDARKIRIGRQHLPSESGSQLLEFGLALPILLVLIVGIWDFGSAFAMKQKLTNAARAADRIMVSTPYRNPYGATGCTTTVPCAVVSAATATQNYLTDASLDASWITPSSPTVGNCEWTYSGGTGSNEQLDIKANVYIGTDGTVYAAGTQPAGSIWATEITLIMPLNWTLGNFLPSAGLPTSVSTTVTMPNIGGGCVQ